jgi:hypothetical protein
MYKYPSGGSWDSDWLQAGWPRGRSSSPGRDINFLLSTSSRPVLGPIQVPIKWVPRVKRLGCEADPSPATSVEVKNTWIYTPSPPYVYMAWCLISQALRQLYLLPLGVAQWNARCKSVKYDNSHPLLLSTQETLLFIHSYALQTLGYTLKKNEFTECESNELENVWKDT